MSSNPPADIVIKFGGDATGLNKNLDKMESKFRSFNNKSNKSLKSLSGAFLNFKTVIGSAAIGGLAVYAQHTATATREMENLARVMNTSVGDAQGITFAFNQMGIAGEKAQDIFKDLNERIGEFVNFGTGPFKDYADAMGLTESAATKLAQQISTMSGPDGLQYLYNQMEQAGFSSAQIRSVLESLTSDASLLIPILKDNGKEFNNLKSRIDELGKPSNRSLQLFAKLAEDSEVAKQAFSNFSQEALAPIAGLFSDATIAAGAFFSTLTKEIRGLKDTIEAEKELNKVINGSARDRRGRAISINQEAKETNELIDRNEELRKKIDSLTSSHVSLGRMRNPERIKAIREQREAEVATLREEITLNEQRIQQLSKINEGAAKVASIKTKAPADPTKTESTGDSPDTSDDSALKRAQQTAARWAEFNSKYREDEFTKRAEFNTRKIEEEARFEEEMRVMKEELKLADLTKQGEWQTLIEQAEKQHQDKLKQIEWDGLSARERMRSIFNKGVIQSTISMLSTLNNAQDTNNKKDFERQKKRNVALATISTAAAVVQSFLNGGGYPWGLVPAGLMAAQGFAQIQNIKKQQYSGGGGSPSVASGGSSGGGSTQPQQQPNAGVLTVEGLDENALYSGSRLQGMAQALNEHARNGGQTFFK